MNLYRALRLSWTSGVLIAYDRYQLRTTFFQLPASRVLELVAQRQSNLDAVIDKLEADASNCRDEMATLKAGLTAKFGSAVGAFVLDVLRGLMRVDQINLER